MTNRRKFWTGFFLVISMIAAGVTYAVVSVGWEYALIVIGGVGICLAFAMVFVIGIAMMVDAKVSK